MSSSLKLPVLFAIVSKSCGFVIEFDLRMECTEVVGLGDELSRDIILSSIEYFQFLWERTVKDEKYNLYKKKEYIVDQLCFN